MFSQRNLPRIIPVLDVMDGQVVRAVAGRRAEYRPVVSKLTTSTDPTEVAKVLLAATGATELYVADLDAIRGRNGITPALSELSARLMVPIWLDSGTTGARAFADLLHGAGVPSLRLVADQTRHVIALESGFDPRVACGAVKAAYQPMAFSLDLKDGKMLGEWARWGAKDEHDVLPVVRTATRCGLDTVIVLDLARVGTGTGTGTEKLLGQLHEVMPGIDLIAGGGVRTREDVERLGEAGATGVLVASALHDGTLI